MNIQLKDVDNVVFNGIDISAVKFNNVLVWQKWETIEYTGVVPVTVTANGEPLLDYLVKGNMVQSGTPTPTTPIIPQECGDRTGNLFDKNGETLVGNGAVINITKTGIKTIVQTQGSNRYSAIQLDNELLGKTITICATITQSASNKGQIRLYYVNGRYATSLIASITTAGQTGYITRTYTMPSSIPSGSDGIAIVLSADRDGDGEVGDYVIYADLMIAEGSTALPYEPYGYKLPFVSGDTTTPIYLGEVPTTRQVKKLVLTGLEDWTIAGDSNSHTFRFIITDYLRNSTNIIVCSHYEGLAPVNGVIGFNGYDYATAFLLSSSGNNYYYIKDIDYTTTSQFMTYLQQQYAAGTPVTVWYVLANEQTGILNEPIRKIGDYSDSISMEQAGVQIPTVSGANVVDIDTTLKPSSIYLKYKGRSDS